MAEIPYIYFVWFCVWVQWWPFLVLSVDIVQIFIQLLVYKLPAICNQGFYLYPTDGVKEQMIFDYIGPLENASKKDQNITFFGHFAQFWREKYQNLTKKGYFLFFFTFWGLKRVFRKNFFLKYFFFRTFNRTFKLKNSPIKKLQYEVLTIIL